MIVCTEPTSTGSEKIPRLKSHQSTTDQMVAAVSSAFLSSLPEETLADIKIDSKRSKNASHFIRMLTQIKEVKNATPLRWHDLLYALSKFYIPWLRKNTSPNFHQSTTKYQPNGSSRKSGLIIITARGNFIQYKRWNSRYPKTYVSPLPILLTNQKVMNTPKQFILHLYTQI